ncbi:MAG: complex I NDUFA9 subunit family protein [Anaerolineales bacterium]
MILVTGGGGYVGSHIVRRLAKGGEQVRALVRDRRRVEREGRLEELPVEIVAGDVTVPDSLPPAFGGVRSVIHTVAIAIEKGGRTYEQVNYQGTVNIVDAAQVAGVRRFINLSQLGADSALPYRFLASKGRAQEYVAGSGMEWTAFRPSVIWGPEDEFANTFAKLIPFSPLIYPIVGDESSRFQPIWVEDAVTSMLKALPDPTTHGREYELGGPEILTLEEIERRTLAAVDTSRAMVRFPMPLLRVIVAFMEALLPAPPVTRSLLELLAVSNVPEENALPDFVSDPRPFTPKNISNHMAKFRARSTVAQFLGRS